ncbi:hypothetical protein PSV08DRAFT_391395 [Bipolaris maydis]|nr:hypothetical protein J3E73DRAFT_412346 [Bipolaris maydis]KAJ6270165.1 hypothetical protein PSV08DRAFT_391395 [Bipolaris maydis]
MPKTNHPRIAPTEWQNRKETIQKLYLSEDKSLMGEGGVIETMKGKGFFASKPQYEAQFMRWGFKKKLTRENWHTIGHIIKNRDKLGRVSHVYAYGTRLSSDKVKKETSRYKACDANKECCTNQTLPVGIEVQSDEKEVEETAINLEAQNTHLSNTSATRLSIELNALGAPWNLALGSDPFQAIDCQIPDNMLLANLPTPIPIDDLSPNVNLWETGSLVSYSQQSPFNRCHDVAGNSSLGISRLGKAFSIPMNTMSLFSNLNIPLFHEFRALLKDNQPKIFASIHQMRHLLPSEPNQLQKASMDLVILKQILYLLLNNFAGSDYAVFDTIFEQVRQFPIAHMEGMLEALPHPYAAALQQSILTIAIKSNIPILVEVIVRRGLDSNRVTCRFGGETFTPLGLACQFRRLEVVEVLLRAGADTNRTVHNLSEQTPTWLLIKGDIKNHGEASCPPVVSNILQQLLDHDARMNWQDLNHGAFWKTDMLVDVFIHHNKFPFNRVKALKSYVARVFEMIMEFKQEEKIPHILQSIFRNDPVSLNESSIVKESVVKLLGNASYKGNLGLIDYLLERLELTPSSTDLCEAVRGNQPLVVTRYIQMGVDIDGLCNPSRSQRFFAKILSSDADTYLLEGCSINLRSITPFAEAIRWGNQGMIDLLKSLGVLNATMNEQNFESVITAAAETANADLVQELLAMRKKRFLKTSNSLIVRNHWGYQTMNQHLSAAVTAAVLRGRKDIVELLMANGVRPDFHSVVAAILTRDLQLFELLLDTAIYSAYSGLLTFAVRWGNQHVMKLLMVRGIDPSHKGIQWGYLGFSQELQETIGSPLYEAMKRGDTEIFQLLLDNGANCNSSDSDMSTSPLKEAIDCGRETFTYKLLAYGADPRDSGALKAAVRKSHQLVIVILRSFRERYPDNNGAFAIPVLRAMIKEKNETMVRTLATHAPLNIIEFRKDTFQLPQDRELLTLLGQGINTGSVKIVQILLECGGDPNSTVEVAGDSPYRGRYNAILKAISTGNLAMVELLHKAGADLKFSATVGITHTSLQLAIDLGHFEIIQYLLDQGVDVNAPPCIWGGGTALQFAAKTGSVRIAEMLFERGADINHTGSKYRGKSAFEFAAEHGRMDMLLWLFHRGVDIVSDGGERVRRACEFAEENGQIASRDLAEQLGREAQQNFVSTSYQTFW